MMLHKPVEALFEPEPTSAAFTTVLQARRLRGMPLGVLGALTALFEGLVAASTVIVVGAAHYTFVRGHEWAAGPHIELGFAIAFLIVASSFLQGTYRSDQLRLIGKSHEKLAASIVFSILAVILVLFVSKTTMHYSRIVILLSFAANWVALGVSRRIAARAFEDLLANDRLSLPRVMLVHGAGQPRPDERAARRTIPWHDVVAEFDLMADSGAPHFPDAVRQAHVAVHAIAPDAVMLCLPWSQHRTIEGCVAALADLPVAIHLDKDPQIQALSELPMPGTDSALGVMLVRPPLTRTQFAVKRAFDIVMSAVGLVLLAPVLGLIALAIKLDSPGPVLFRQKRSGYNRQPFDVFKFRSMSEESCASEFRQATRNDRRVTRIGRILRPTSLDELPQLLNVLGGSMSLVGPRPHPFELDDAFMPQIAQYVKRHKIRPGITGWAQVNGHRGETGSAEIMRRRVEHDLHYVNHWSFLLDLKILVLTIVSLAAHRNAV